MDIENEIHLRERLAKQEQDMESVHRRLDALESITESIRDLAVEMREIKTDVKSVKENVGEMSERVEEVENRPKKHYDAIIAALITGIITFILGKFF